MHQEGIISALVVSLILVTYLLASHVIKALHVTFLHQSVIAITLGAVASLIASLAQNPIDFNNSFFFNIILPPIIFVAGYNLRKSLFFQHFGIISFMGILGTLISFLIIASSLYLLSRLLGGLDSADILYLSAVLCATDTVAPLALVKQDRFPRLNSVLFGEGIINDATAIILFNAIRYSLSREGAHSFVATFLLVGFDFAYLFLLSILVGLCFGLGLSYFFKRASALQSVHEIGLIVLISYLSYLCAELLGLSGIIALFVCGIIMGHYCYLNISNPSKLATGVSFQAIGNLFQAFVFAYLGLTVFSVKASWQTVWYCLALIPIFLVSRLAAVFVLPLAYKAMRKEYPLQFKELLVCVYSGLIRGAIAFALSLQIMSANKELLASIVLIIVLSTMLTLGSLLGPFMTVLNLGQEAEPKSAYNTIANVERPTATQVEKFWFQFEEKYVYPVFKKEEVSYLTELGSPGRDIKQSLVAK